MSTHHRLQPLAVLATVLAMVAVVLVLGSRPAHAAASLDISQTTGLSDGQSVTISGSGFSPNMTQIAVGQCIEGMAGPADCNLAGGATFVNADADGNFGPVTLTVAAQFNDFDCTVQQCILGAQILPQAADEATVAANTVYIDISFAAADDGDDDDPVDDGDDGDDGDDPTDDGDDGDDASDDGDDASDDGDGEAAGSDDQDDELAETGPEGLSVVGLWTTALVLLGGGLVLFRPRGRRGDA